VQCSAAWCSVVQRGAAWCSMVQCGAVINCYGVVATRCDTQRVAVCGCVAVRCSAVDEFDAGDYSVLQCVLVLECVPMCSCCSVQLCCSALWCYNVLQCSQRV